jgi:hypothetical protein
VSEETTTTADNGTKGKREPSDRDVSTPVVKNEALFAFLEALFYGPPEPEQYPERVEVNVVAGRASEQLKATVWSQQFAPIKATGEVLKRSTGQGKPSRERLAALSNLLLQSMQQDCDQCGKRRSYGVHAWSTVRGDNPYMRFLWTVDPKGRYPRGAAGGDEEDDLDAKDRFVVQVMDQYRKMFEVHTEAMAGLVDRYNRDKERDSNEIDKLHRQKSAINEQLDRALSMELDREERREWVRLRRQMADRGWQALETYGPLLVGSLIGKNKVIDSPANANADAAVIESLRTFLKTTEEGGTMTMQQAIAAFGDWDEKSGALITAGALSAEQAGILLQVATGKVPVDAIDRLIPPRGPNAITPDQFIKLTQIFTREQLEPLRDLFMKRQQGAT